MKLLKPFYPLVFQVGRYASINRGNMSKYINTLKECSEIAQQEYKYVSKKLKKLKKDFTSSQNILVETILKLDKSDINDKIV